MASFAQTKDVLDYCRSLHHRLIACYEASPAASAGERERLVLRYLIDQERRLAEGLEETRRTLSAPALTRWFQYLPETEITETLECECGVPGFVDDILSLALRCRDELIQVYEKLAAASAGTEKARELFGELAHVAKKERDHLVVAVQRFQEAQ